MTGLDRAELFCNHRLPREPGYTIFRVAAISATTDHRQKTSTITETELMSSKSITSEPRPMPRNTKIWVYRSGFGILPRRGICWRSLTP